MNMDYSKFSSDGLALMVQRMHWRWSLEKISEGSLGDRWIVWDENHLAIGDASTPNEALYMAFVSPMNDERRKYSPRW